MGYDPGNADFRIYVTGDSANPNTIAVWGLNFDDAQPVTVNLGLAPCQIVSATLKHYGKAGPDSSGGDPRANARIFCFTPLPGGTNPSARALPEPQAVTL